MCVGHTKLHRRDADHPVCLLNECKLCLRLPWVITSNRERETKCLYMKKFSRWFAESTSLHHLSLPKAVRSTILTRRLFNKWVPRADLLRTRPSSPRGSGIYQHNTSFLILITCWWFLVRFILRGIFPTFCFVFLGNNNNEGSCREKETLDLLTAQRLFTNARKQSAKMRFPNGNENYNHELVWSQAQMRHGGLEELTSPHCPDRRWPFSRMMNVNALGADDSLLQNFHDW